MSSITTNIKKGIANCSDPFVTSRHHPMFENGFFCGFVVACFSRALERSHKARFLGNAKPGYKHYDLGYA